MQRWLDFLHLVDSAFPTGSYAHSFGLESLGPERLEEHLATRLRETLGRLELVFVVHAYSRPLAVLDVQLEAMLLPREARQASAAIGTAMLRGACDVLAEPRLEAFLADGPFRHQAVVFGALADALGVPPAAAAETYAFGSLRGQVSAAQRLGWLGQRDAQRLLHALKPAVRRAGECARALDPEQAGAFAPAWDIAEMAHETASARMFAS